ncbi:MAG: hypothetical protein AAB495_02715 [Patescibacteria group bacterium]
MNVTEKEKLLRRWIASNYRNDNASDWNDPDQFKKNIHPHLPEGLNLFRLPIKNDACHNCYVYAFGLNNDASFERALLGTENRVQELVDGKILKEISSPVVGDYIIYKNNKVIKHAGIFQGGNIVISKWGLGPVFKHPIFAVHPGYGAEISYYKKTNPDTIKKGLIRLKCVVFDSLI